MVKTRTLTLRNVPETLVRELRDRAKKNGRSMQAELLSVVSATVIDRASLVEQLRECRNSLVRPMSLDAIHEAVEEGQP